MALTIRPKVSATPRWVIAPPLTSLITIAPVPANTSAKVPRNSAANWRIAGQGNSESTDDADFTAKTTTQSSVFICAIRGLLPVVASRRPRVLAACRLRRLLLLRGCTAGAGGFGLGVFSRACAATRAIFGGGVFGAVHGVGLLVAHPELPFVAVGIGGPELVGNGVAAGHFLLGAHAQAGFLDALFPAFQFAVVEEFNAEVARVLVGDLCSGNVNKCPLCRECHRTPL